MCSRKKFPTRRAVGRKGGRERENILGNQKISKRVGAAMKTLKRFVQAYNVFLFSFYLLSLHWKCTISLWMVCACAVCTKGETTCRHRPWWLFHFSIIFFPRYALFVFNLLFHSFAFFYFFLFDFRASATWNCKACIRCQQLSYLMLCTVESRTTLLSTNHHWSIVSKISRGSKRHCIIINSLWEWKKNRQHCPCYCY